MDLNNKLNNLNLNLDQNLDLDLDNLNLDENLILDLNKMNFDNYKKPISKIYHGNRYQLFLKRYPFMKFFDQKFIKGNLEYFLYGDLNFIESNNNKIIYFLDEIKSNHESLFFFWMYIYIYSQVSDIKQDINLVDKLNNLLEPFRSIIKDRTVDILELLINF